jgi:hypothetical protein
VNDTADMPLFCSALCLSVKALNWIHASSDVVAVHVGSKFSMFFHFEPVRAALLCATHRLSAISSLGAVKKKLCYKR